MRHQWGELRHYKEAHLFWFKMAHAYCVQASTTTTRKIGHAHSHHFLSNHLLDTCRNGSSTSSCHSGLECLPESQGFIRMYSCLVKSLDMDLLSSLLCHTYIVPARRLKLETFSCPSEAFISFLGSIL